MIEIILNLINQAGITNNKLLSDLKLPSSAISEWKRGKAKPSADALIKIADYFNVSVDYLLGREQQPHSTAIPYNGVSKHIVELPPDITDNDLQIIKLVLDKYN